MAAAAGPEGGRRPLGWWGARCRTRTRGPAPHTAPQASRGAGFCAGMTLPLPGHTPHTCQPPCPRPVPSAPPCARRSLRALSEGGGGRQPGRPAVSPPRTAPETPTMPTQRTPWFVPPGPHYLLHNAFVPECCLAPAMPGPDGTPRAPPRGAGLQRLVSAAGDVDALVHVDIEVKDGLIARVARATARPPDAPGPPCIDLRGGVVLPCFADVHTHIGQTGIGLGSAGGKWGGSLWAGLWCASRPGRPPSPARPPAHACPPTNRLSTVAPFFQTSPTRASGPATNTAPCRGRTGRPPGTLSFGTRPT